MPRALHAKVKQAGAAYKIYEGQLDGASLDEMLTGRLVCDWSMDPDSIDQFLELITQD